MRTLTLALVATTVLAGAGLAQMSPQLDGATEIPRERVAVSWAIDAAPAAAPQVFRAASRDYQLLVRDGQLADGVELPLTARGAVIRISPVDAAGQGIAAADLALTAPSGAVRPLAGVANALVSGDQLAEAGMAVDSRALAVRFADDLQPGSYRLSASSAVQGSYWISVREPKSSVVLDLGADRDAYVEGSRLRVRGGLVDPSGRMLDGATFAGAESLVVAPDGARYEVGLRTEGGAVVGGLDLPSLGAATNAVGLWELHLQVEGTAADGTRVLRHAKTAFAVAPRTARLVAKAGGEVARLRRDDTYSAVVRVRDAGRFEVSGVLYGRAADGSEQAIALAQTAQWLEPGRGEIALEFDRGLIEKSGLSAPFVVRDLSLRDQGRLAVLE